MSTEPQLVSHRQVIAAEQLHRYADPYDVIVQTQIRAETDLRQYAADRDLQIGSLQVTWECRVEAMTA